MTAVTRPGARPALDPSACFRALAARDARFDGLFFVGVATTGIYCRPVCPARTPRADRCAYFRSAAEAEREGFRACFRCRPELAPGGAPLDAVPRLVAAALARIDAGALNDGSVDDLAAEFGVTGRHLRRALEREIGVTPVALAQTRRLALAKRLLHDTTLGLAEIALASGFGSVRRFNAAFLARFGAPPSRLRERRAAGAPGGSAPGGSTPGGGTPGGSTPRRGTPGGSAAGAPREIELRLDYRAPYDAAGLFAFLGERAIPGVEELADGVYARTVRLGGAAGRIAVRHEPARGALVARVPDALFPVLMPLTARLRALFDLDARPDAIAGALARDPALAPLVRACPGRRVPGAIDGFEALCRAILGQQVSVRGARTLAGRLVERFGDPLPGGMDTDTGTGEPWRLFPAPTTLAAAQEGDVAAIGLPRARARTLVLAARAVAKRALRLDARAPVEPALAALAAIPGIGPWTLQYVALRALHDPDAFPAGDLGVRKALGGLGAAAANARAEGWRPWRAYAVAHLWASLAPHPTLAGETE